MTDARLRLIVLSVIAVLLLAATFVLVIRGDAVPTDLQVLTGTVIGVFTGHVYMNGTGSGTGGPGAQ